jgi:hypothetical protein
MYLSRFLAAKNSGKRLVKNSKGILSWQSGVVQSATLCRVVAICRWLESVPKAAGTTGQRERTAKPNRPFTAVQNAEPLQQRRISRLTGIALKADYAYGVNIIAEIKQGIPQIKGCFLILLVHTV